MSDVKNDKKFVHLRLNEKNSADIVSICAQIGREDVHSELTNRIVASVSKEKKLKIAQEIQTEDLRAKALKDPKIMALVDEAIRNNYKK